MTHQRLRALGLHGFHRMAYTEWGSVGSPALLCVHGLTRTGRDFDPLAHALAADFRVIGPDLPGRGASGSDLLLPATVEKMRRRGPPAEVVEFAGAGHAPALLSAD